MSHRRYQSVSYVDLVQKLPDRKAFDANIKVLQDCIGGESSNISIIQKDGVIYATKTIHTPTIQEQKEVLEEWELVRDLKLLGYHELYNDTENEQMVIVQDYLPCNLLQYMSNQKQFKSNLPDTLHYKHYTTPSSLKRHSSRSDFLYPHLPESEAKHIAISVLSKLRRMHRCGFVHCDVKPENIMKLTNLNKDMPSLSVQDWRVIDFGLRVRFNVEKGYSLASWRGTIGWTPPELVPNNGDNNRIYPQLDVWCMGLVILYMVTGENPFELTIQECKENKLYNLESGKRYWYYHKLLPFNKKKKWNHHLRFLHKKNKISLNLLDLLLNHMLVYDPKKRSTIKTVLKHSWFKDVMKVRPLQQQKTVMIAK